MASTRLAFASQEEHRTWLETQAPLPAGFRVGTASFAFTPVEAPKPARMTVTLLALDRPTPDFAAVFTRNAFPGAPVILGRQRLDEPTLGAVVVNNKISNVHAPGGVASAETICAAVADRLGLAAPQVLPSSTGVIGWQLPVEAMLGALPEAVAGLASGSVLPAALGIMTTDLYPKVRRANVGAGAGAGAGSVVGIAKGAGMIEPNMATLLVYLLTDLAIPREALRAALRRAVNRSFNLVSVDTDTSTSDTVLALSSGRHPCPDLGAFEAALLTVCQDLAEDVVRNGEGVHHVVRVTARGCPNDVVARGVAKAVVNSPLVKTAICGNDPNVGRIVMAIGKFLGAQHPAVDVSAMKLRLGGHLIFEDGVFRLDPAKEAALVEHLRQAELYTSAAAADGVFQPPVRYPRHERAVELEIDLGAGPAETQCLGADLTHEYVSENADYRS
jgi:glutamate N-acetyltransferase/amino-acid N-acetyltransferase